MKTKLLTSLTAAAAAATALLSFSGSAHAFGFGTSGISFDKDTAVTFKYIQSMGANKSSLGIYTVSGNTATKVFDLFSEKDRSDSFSAIGNAAAKATGYLGTAANLTGPAQTSFKFLAGQVYTLGLYNKGWVSEWTRYSTTALNTKYGLQHAAFGSSGSKTADGQALAGVGSFQSTNPFVSGGVVIGFEDAADGGDRDYNDFIVTAEAVPEPITMGGLALGFGGMVMARRRMNRKTA